MRNQITAIVDEWATTLGNKKQITALARRLDNVGFDMSPNERQAVAVSIGTGFAASEVAALPVDLSNANVGEVLLAKPESEFAIPCHRGIVSEQIRVARPEQSATPPWRGLQRALLERGRLALFRPRWI